MNSKNRLAYVTYQSFPADTANSLQTITNIIELTRLGVNVELVFPERDITCSDNLEKLKEFILDDNFKISITNITYHLKNSYFRKIYVSHKSFFMVKTSGELYK